MNFIEDLFKYQYLQYAFLASIFVSIICGLIGVIIVEKKLVMMTGGIAHTSYGGVGLGYLLGFSEPIIGAFVFSIIAALGIGAINNNDRLTGMKDVMTAIFWSLGMSLGILFISLMSNYPPDVTSYLFGNILSVTSFNLILISLITFLVATVILLFYHDWKAHLFDQEFMMIKGRKTKLMENVLMILIALSVVALIRVVGIVLVIAMLSIPAATASLLTKRLHSRIILSIVFGLVFTIFGLVISYYTNYATGPVIVIFAFIIYIIVRLISRTIINRQALQ